VEVVERVGEKLALAQPVAAAEVLGFAERVAGAVGDKEAEGVRVPVGLPV